MERNTKTEVGNLVFGDRFYKCNDKKREVWTKQHGEVRYAKGLKHYASKDGDNCKTAVKEETEVIFLRNKID